MSRPDMTYEKRKTGELLALGFTPEKLTTFQNDLEK